MSSSPDPAPPVAQPGALHVGARRAGHRDRAHRHCRRSASATTSTCSYNTSNKNLLVTDKSGDHGLRVFRVGEQIRISDEPGTAGVFCPDSRPAARHCNGAEHGAVGDLRSAPNLQGGVTIDQYAGGPFRGGGRRRPTGQSEIEISIVDDIDSGFPVQQPTRGLRDPGGRLRSWSALAAALNLGFDADVDIEPTVKPGRRLDRRPRGQRRLSGAAG